jgi:hypothetical protein
MKEKTSITLSREMLAGIDRMAGSKQPRAQIEARDLELLDKAADELNEEVEDILRYQQA